MTGEPQVLVTSIAGKIWHKTIPKTEIETTKARLPVISARLQAGRTIVRTYADSALEAGFEQAEPDLEDVYFSAIAGYLALKLSVMPA
jgi:hypothetical protein